MKKKFKMIKKLLEQQTLVYWVQYFKNIKFYTRWLIKSLHEKDMLLSLEGKEGLHWDEAVRVKTVLTTEQKNWRT